MKDLIIWNAVSMAWTEIGLDADEYRELAVKLSKNYQNWNDVDKVIRQDVCAAFAVNSLALVLAFIPLIGLFFIASMPDWGYSEDYLKSKISKWHSQSRWIHFLNPLRIIGYPIALLSVWRIRRKLKREFDLVRIQS